ncbi:MAG: exodeoxyribonuclease VII large subunit [Bacilli bacterium]|nr:exodeoxyribonuclease VII large subunit [Bacilli bacterium]
MNNERKFISVKELNEVIKENLEGNFLLRNITVKGEISNWKIYRSGVFFDLKDGESVISCTMWNNALNRIKFIPGEGDEVLATGSISVYIARGRYSLSVNFLEEYGKGNLLLELEKLKAKLYQEGLFDESRKREIPRFPKKIGIIVGKDSAAEADLRKNIARRWPVADLYVYYSLVQGDEAPKELLKAFNLAQTEGLDTLIIARGGGSIEDLWAFNDETFARAVANSKMPVISAIGHEIDFTIIDYVSDKRVSTPTAAAEMATPDIESVRSFLMDMEERLQDGAEKKIKGLRDKVEALASRPFFKNPASQYEKTKEEVRQLEQRLRMAAQRYIDKKSSQVAELSSMFKAMNPENVIKRGYSLTETEDGRVVKSIKDVKPGDKIKTKMKDGTIESVVK